MNIDINHNIRVRHLKVILIFIIYVNVSTEEIFSLVSSQQTGCMTTSGHMLGILYFYLDTSSTSSSPTLVETWDSPVISHIR